MGMNLAGMGGAAGIGLLSSYLYGKPGIDLGTTAAPNMIPADLIAEGVAVVGGVALQMLMPYTMPDVVDGVVNGGLALLAKHVGAGVFKTSTGTGGSPYSFPMATRVGALQSGARGLNASGVASNRYQFI